jgi:hypothetical protein
VSGGLAYAVAGTVKFVGSTAAALCAAVTVITRLAAVTVITRLAAVAYGWELPTAGDPEPPMR